MKRNRFVFLILAIVIMMSSAACTSLNGAEELDEGEPVTIYAFQDSPHFKSIDSLSEKADAIVRGRVINTHIEEINDLIKSDSHDEQLNPGGNHTESKRIYTIFTIEIDEIYKGEYNASDTIEVKQLGGQLGNTTLIAEERVDITKENSYILFVTTYSHSPASLLNATQSVYIYETESGKSDEKEKVNSSATIINVHHKNDLLLTIEDLNSIKDRYK